MRPLLLISIVAVLATGCSTTASISRFNGPPVEAKIRGGDSDAFYVETAAGHSMSLPRAEVTDIDHPGNVSAVIGGIIGTYGVLNIAVGAPLCSVNSASCVGVFLPAAVGIPMLVWGLWTWMNSKSAAESIMPTQRPPAASL